jgi:hypothetical protein
MTDIVERIRKLRFVHIPGTSDLMEEACQEIERLRNGSTCPHIRGAVTQHCSLNFTLADEERAALHWFAHYGLPEHRAATLRSVLERLT